jgi:N-acetyl-1-D-myo-inositol-2-amino-2-deoxy-alpha-D-glucopyranoside deacetylase
MSSHNGSLDILFVLAHPDDESFGNAGTMMLAHGEGMTTGLLCATRGEVGEIRDPALATRDTLPAVRERELRQAMRLARLTELRLLGFRDSGMAGTPPNEDPRALVNVPFVEAMAHVVGHIRDLKPRVVVSFGPDGVYGHPDHIAIGAITDAAVVEAAGEGHPGLGDPWRVEAYYHVASSRERILASAKNPDSPFSAMSEDELERMGVPEASITHWIDVTSRLEEKFEVVLQHRTQISVNHPIMQEDLELARTMLGRETYALQDLPWNGNDADPLSRLRDAFPATAGLSAPVSEVAHEEQDKEVPNLL